MARPCGYHMAPYEECTWHESHVVAFSTYCMCSCDTWHMANGSYEGHMSSERNRKVGENFLFLDQTKENKFGGGEKNKKKRNEEIKERRGI